MSTPALSEVALSDYAKEYDNTVPERTMPRVLEFDIATDSEYNRHLDRVVWWKMDLCVLPAATLIFFLSFLDRSNISNARVAGLQEQLGMTDYQYTIALTVTYVPYILIEIPSNLLLKRVGANILLPLMLTLWGIVTVFHGLITSYSGLIAARFFLGLCEGGLLPGLCLYLSCFYPRRKLQLRIAIFFCSSALAGAFSGLLATAIIQMNGVGNKPGWAWIFVLEGLFTVLSGLALFFLMPSTPAHAPFFTTEEKRYVLRYLQRDGVFEGSPDDYDGWNVSANVSGDESAKAQWREVLRTLVRPQVVLLIAAGFFNGATLFGLAFTPSIVASFGYAGNQAQLMSVPPFAAAYVLSLVTSFISDRYGRRGATIIACALVSIVGFAMFLGSMNPHVRYASLFLLLPGTYCAAPPLAAWTANNTAPHTRRAAAIALLTTLTNAGGILATWLLGALSPAPGYVAAAGTFLGFQVGIVGCAAGAWMWMRGRNRGGRVLAGGAAQVQMQMQVQVGGEGKGASDESPWFEYTM
ncbi:hypothetical protein EIP86_002723 [Pleurotus ostreatoroseus]|nr:hypothetical protein EIP86_002723 [Pleurotus ostreatoroseus]